MIPLRPPRANTYDLTPEEMDCLTWYCISGCQREDAFLKFARPDFNGSKPTGTIKSVVAQFFAMKNVKEYIEAYKATLTETLAKSKQEPVVKPASNTEEKKAKAKAKLVEFAVSLADHIEDAEDPEAVLKIADKVGLLDQEEQVEEQPRRYLPECCQQCAYRLFCEQNTVDMCQFCRAWKFAVENGFKCDKTQLLDIPADFGTNLAEESE